MVATTDTTLPQRPKQNVPCTTNYGMKTNLTANLVQKGVRRAVEAVKAV